MLSWSIRIRTRYGGTGTRVPSSGPDSGTCVPAPAPENSKVNLIQSLIQSLNLRSTAYQCPLSLSVSVSLFQFLRQYINHKRDPVLLCYLLNSCIGYAFHTQLLPLYTYRPSRTRICTGYGCAYFAVFARTD